MQTEHIGLQIYSVKRVDDGWEVRADEGNPASRFSLFYRRSGADTLPRVGSRIYVSMSADFCRMSPDEEGLYRRGFRGIPDEAKLIVTPTDAAEGIKFASDVKLHRPAGEIVLDEEAAVAEQDK